ncbi:Serine/threonine-protein kinase PrkC [Gimesia alba]|uniref:Serine/threonine-protein kinase PrkC n=1 Tax=Gimesia alba TaxID=2527973 RepID=A0A517RM29_9PLAN|nr:serine/threonine-protein kinase [Gimesia alba]QDT44946.1 Serine/threonine-protein kinase PrkC [Gimesia alba]
MVKPINYSQDFWNQLEKVVSEYEDALRNGNALEVETIWRSSHNKELVLLFELVHTELEWRLKAGEAVRVEEYLERFPELSEDIDALHELISTEYILRLRTNSKVEVSEYTNRFPHFGESLISRLHDAAKQDQPNYFPHSAHEESVSHSQNLTRSQREAKTTDSSSDQTKQNLSHQKYGRYIVKELLGKGSFGQVFLAYDPKTKRNVALKVPQQSLQPGSEEYERFLREARAVAALQHQNICPLFDLLETNDRIVLVMPYIEGKSLVEIIEQRNLSLEKSIQLVRTLALAMAYAHEAGVIHRDLKPANILIDEKRSQPVITDFGLALLENSDETKLTHQGQLLGTPAYLSPEQASGDLKRIGPASDIYSLGMILYELCTGELPFAGSVSSVIGQILSKEPAAPSLMNSNIPTALEHIILKAIAKIPTDRFSSMKEFAAILEQLNQIDNKSISLDVTVKHKIFDPYRKWWIVTFITILFLTAVIGMFFNAHAPPPESKPKVLQNVSTESIPVFSKQIDLLREIVVPGDVIIGHWALNPDGLMVIPQQYSRLSIPVHIDGDYQLELELTRKWGGMEINLIFPVGNKACMLSLGREDWCGLQLVNGHEFGQVLQDHFPNGQRHKLTLTVSTREQQASIKAKLNDLSILDWSGSVDALALRRDWQIPKKDFGLGAHYEQVIFHKMMLNVERDTKISRAHWVKSKTEEYQEWKDLLDKIELPQLEFNGTWKLVKSIPQTGNGTNRRRELESSREDYSRLILPVVPTGDYQLLVQLTRLSGMGEINLLLPVGNAFCMVSLGNEGNQFRIQNINGEYWGVKREGIIVNGKQHIVEVEVTLGKDDSATIFLKIDHQEIFRWQGKQSELSIRDDWRIHPVALGLGVHSDLVRFQQVLFRNKTGTVFQLERE